MRDSTKELIADYLGVIALMKLEDGVTQFECRAARDDKWIDCLIPTEPIWNSVHAKYRVKPKPIEAWAWKYPKGEFFGLYGKKQPDDTGPTGRVMILLREVTE